MRTEDTIITSVRVLQKFTLNLSVSQTTFKVAVRLFTFFLSCRHFAHLGQPRWVVCFGIVGKLESNSAWQITRGRDTGMNDSRQMETIVPGIGLGASLLLSMINAKSVRKDRGNLNTYIPGGVSGFPFSVLCL